MAKEHLQKVYLENSQITNDKERVIDDLRQQLEVAQHEVSLFVVISPKWSTVLLTSC